MTDPGPVAAPAADPARARWAAVRAAARTFVAARLGRELAQALLPIEATEHGIAPLPLPPQPRTFAELARCYPELLHRDARKRHGAWFTAEALVVPTVRRALACATGPWASASTMPTGAISAPRIVDPAVGGGAFLLAALHELVAGGLPAADAVLRLHGVDVDGTAAALAALALWEACGDGAPDPRRIAANVHQGDGLIDLADGTFDVVLTNPPWETLQSDAAARARAAALRPLFHHQGRGKLFTYRLFVERTLRLLRPGGGFGLVVPASLWFDRDAEPLRRCLLDTCDLQWLFGFENTKKLFAIDGRYRFAVVVGSTGATTAAVRVAFGRTDPADWAAATPPHAVYGRDALRALSPASGAFVEIEHERDLAILHRLHGRGRPLLGPDGVFRWRQGDFNLTADRGAFVLRFDAEADGYRRGEDAVWRRPGAVDLLPLYQGAMLHDLHPNAGAHAGGTGHATRWEPPADPTDLRPAYLVDAAAWRRGAAARPPARIALRALSNATNARTAIACLLPDVPCGNSLGVLSPRAATTTPLRTLAAGAAVLASLPFDWALRLRLGGTNLNGFVLADCFAPRLDAATEAELARLALRLCAVLPWHAAMWAQAAAEGWCDRREPALDATERHRLATAIDVAVGRAFGLQCGDVAWIVRGCDRPRAASSHRKGFWRVDRELPPAERRPQRWLAAVAD